MSLARDHALLALDARPLPGWKTAAAPRSFRPPPLLDSRDVSLRDAIVVGTIKNLLWLQYRISHFSGRAPASIDPLVAKILAIGLFQLRYLTRMPAPVIVDEAVRQAKRAGRARAAGFVNAVLRRCARESDPPPPSPPVGFSHPVPLFDRFVQLLGEERAIALCEHNNAEPPTIVRLFAGRSADELAAPDITLFPHEQPGMIVVEGARVPILADWANAGIAQVQDPTAAAIAAVCDVHPAMAVLDRCCGLGTKTIQLREALGDAGTLLAMDASPARADELRALVSRRRLRNVHVECAAMLGPADPRTFDRILVDVPCSNSGVLARRPEARYHQQPGALKSLAKLQHEILEDAAAHLKPDGLLIYSTCSIWPEENEQIVQAFVSRHPGWHIRAMQSTLPSLSPNPTIYRDGGFWAVLDRQTDPPPQK